MNWAVDHRWSYLYSPQTHEHLIKSKKINDFVCLKKSD